MDDDTVIGTRIEILKVVHRNDFSAEQVVERAKALEAYVLGSTEVGGTPAPSAGTPKKNRVR